MCQQILAIQNHLGKAKNVAKLRYCKISSKYDHQFKDYLKCQQFWWLAVVALLAEIFAVKQKS